MILLEWTLLALLVVLLPATSHRQLRGLDPETLPRSAAYLQSMFTIALFGVVGYGLGLRRSGAEGMGLALEGGLGLSLARAALLCGLGLAIVLAFEAWLGRTGRPRSPWVRALIPRTGRERVLFALLSIVAGVGEEIAFRGFALRALEYWTGSFAVAVLWTSLAFGWIHGYQGTLGRIRASILGLLLALPLAMGWGLLPSILAHTWIDWVGGFVLGPRIISRDARPD